jgi:hypothetical protein
MTEISRVLMPLSDIAQATEFRDVLIGPSGERVSPGRDYFGPGEMILAVMTPSAAR